MEVAGALFSSLAIQAPLVLLWLVGLGIALGRWKRHPRRSLLASVALGILVLDLIFGGLASTFAPLIANEGNLSITDVGLVFAVIGVVRTAVHIVAWVLVLLALFGREPAAEVDRV
jgi:uncharacterized membrane protein YdfJ with MMPL/SSD domain